MTLVRTSRQDPKRGRLLRARERAGRHATATYSRTSCLAWAPASVTQVKPIQGPLIAASSTKRVPSRPDTGATSDLAHPGATSRRAPAAPTRPPKGPRYDPRRPTSQRAADRGRPGGGVRVTPPGRQCPEYPWASADALMRWPATRVTHGRRRLTGVRGRGWRRHGHNDGSERRDVGRAACGRGRRGRR